MRPQMVGWLLVSIGLAQALRNKTDQQCSYKGPETFELATRTMVTQVWTDVLGPVRLPEDYPDISNEEVSSDLDLSRMGFYFFESSAKDFSREARPAAHKLGSATDKGPAEAIPELLTQMALTAPKSSGWFEAITGEKNYPDRVDPGFQGVSWHMAYMMRRAGLNFYFNKMAGSPDPTALYIPYNPSAVGPVASIARHLQIPPPMPDSGGSDLIRVVAIADTHGYHSDLMLPEGDLLIHAGNIGFAEYDAEDGLLFRRLVEEHGSDYSVEDFLVYPLRQSSNLKKWALVGVLEWFQSLMTTAGNRKPFEQIVIVGGNHDYILEQLGGERAKKLCLKYGITYLHGRDAPTLVTVKDRKLTVWGTGMTNTKGSQKSRWPLLQTTSANNAFQLPPNREHGKSTFDLDTVAAKQLAEDQGISWTAVDILVTHSPPVFEGISWTTVGNSWTAVEWIESLAREMKPKLHFYGHVHNKKESVLFSDDLHKVHSGVTDRAVYKDNGHGDNTLAVWCPVLSEFYSLWGPASVVDFGISDRVVH